MTFTACLPQYGKPDHARLLPYALIMEEQATLANDAPRLFQELRAKLD